MRFGTAVGHSIAKQASVKNRIKSATGDDYQKLRMKNVLQFAYATWSQVEGQTDKRPTWQD